MIKLWNFFFYYWTELKKKNMFKGLSSQKVKNPGFFVGPLSSVKLWRLVETTRYA